MLNVLLAPWSMVGGAMCSSVVRANSDEASASWGHMDVLRCRTTARVSVPPFLALLLVFQLCWSSSQTMKGMSSRCFVPLPQVMPVTLRTPETSHRRKSATSSYRPQVTTVRTRNVCLVMARRIRAQVGRRGPTPSSHICSNTLSTVAMISSVDGTEERCLRYCASPSTGRSRSACWIRRMPLSSTRRNSGSPSTGGSRLSSSENQMACSSLTASISASLNPLSMPSRRLVSSRWFGTPL